MLGKMGRIYVGLAGQKPFDARVKEFDKKPTVTDTHAIGTLMSGWKLWVEGRYVGITEDRATAQQRVQNQMQKWGVGLDRASAKQSVFLTLATLELQMHSLVRLLHQTVGIVDLRPTEQFRDCHFPYTTSIAWRGSDKPGLPSAPFQERAHELPGRGTALALISASHDDLSAASSLLLRRGYIVSLAILVPPTVFQTLPGISGPSRQLWKPSFCLRELIGPAEVSICPGFKAGGRHLAVDLGCGGGRESMFLLLRGWRLLAADTHDSRRFDTILDSLGPQPVRCA